jgi:hypothetical protein
MPKKPKASAAIQAKRPKHELLHFLAEAYGAMQSEYDRIRQRVSEDPGTAGDAVEETWAELLRNWLPANYPVVTKGRIVNARGHTSPQFDVLVLHPAYPVSLRNRKLYFADAVVAAFECKLTLRKEHIRQAVERAMTLKDLYADREGSPYEELNKPILVGLLAHTRGWAGDPSRAMSRLDQHLGDALLEVGHPSQLIDLICVADLGVFYLTHMVRVGPLLDDDAAQVLGEDEPDGGIVSCYLQNSTGETYLEDPNARMLGQMISYVMDRLAWEDPSLRRFADYMWEATTTGGIGRLFGWRADVLSPAVRQRILDGSCSGEQWSKWSSEFF